MLLLIQALLSPLVQIGLSYYLSISLVVVIIALVTFFYYDPQWILRRYLVARVLISFLIFVLAFVNPAYTNADVLRVIREATLLFLLTGTFSITLRLSPGAILRLTTTLTVILSLLFLLALAQSFYYSFGAYFGIPRELFVQNSNTLPEELALRFSVLRPAGSFGEPSYFAFYCLGVLYCSASRSVATLLREPVNLLALGCIIVSRSLIGAMGVVLIIMSVLMVNKQAPKAAIQMMFVGAIVAIALMTTDNPISDRLALLGSSEDQSTFIRLFLPVAYIAENIFRNPFGESLLTLASYGYIPLVSTSGADLLDNGATSIIIEFGFLGFAVLALIFLSASSWQTRGFIVIALLQNGAFLSIDKLGLIAMFVALYNAKSRLASEATAASAAPQLTPPVRTRRRRRDGPIALVLLAVVGVVAQARPVSAAQDVLVTVWAGGQSVAVATIDLALDEVRKRRQSGDHQLIRIVIPEGEWRIGEPLRIDRNMASVAVGRLEIVGGGNGKTVISGAENALLREMRDGDPAVLVGRGDLVAVPLPTPSRLQPRDIARSLAVLPLQFYQGGRTLTLSRWPVVGLANASARRSEDGQRFSIGPIAGADGIDWSHEPAPWLGGYWLADWAYEFIAAEAVANGRSFQVGPFAYSNNVRPTVRLFIANSYVQLHVDGSFVVSPDGQTAFLQTFPESGSVEIGRAKQLLRITGASNLSIFGVSFVKSLGDGLVIEGGSDIKLTDISVEQVGNAGISVMGGRNVAVKDCLVRDVGGAGISLSGGDRRTLVGANHSVENCTIENFAHQGRDYQPGIRMEGVGISALGNKISNGYASGLIISGNNNLVKNNEIFNVVKDSDDAGAIYLGRDWTQRGNRIIDNYIHDLVNGAEREFVTAIYLDDQMSGVTLERNIISGVPIGIVMGGGRDNTIKDNWIVRPIRGAISLDERGKVARYAAMQSTLVQRFKAMPVASPAWRFAYPGLTDLLDSDPSAATGNILTGNRTINGPSWTPASPSAMRRPSDNGTLTISVEDEARLNGCLRRPDDCGATVRSEIVEQFGSTRQ